MHCGEGRLRLAGLPLRVGNLEQAARISRRTVRTNSEERGGIPYWERAGVHRARFTKFRLKMRERLSDDLPDDATHSPEKRISLPGLQLYWELRGPMSGLRFGSIAEPGVRAGSRRGNGREGAEPICQISPGGRNSRDGRVEIRARVKSSGAKCCSSSALACPPSVVGQNSGYAL